MFLELKNRQIVSVIEIDDIINLIFEDGLSDAIMDYSRRKKESSE